MLNFESEMRKILAAIGNPDTFYITNTPPARSESNLTTTL